MRAADYSERCPGERHSGRRSPLATADDIRNLETRLTREPSSQAHAALAEAYRRAGRIDEAVSLCRQGLARYPTYSTTRFILAKALLDRDELSDAWSEVERFLHGEPDHEPALRLATECALRRADPEGAVRWLRRLVTLDPDDRSIHAQLRALEIGLGTRPAGAEAGGLWALLADDTFATVTFGDLCMAQGLTDEATTVWSRIVARTPEHAIARQRLAELGRTRAQARRSRG